jgi:hypothetical protein
MVLPPAMCSADSVFDFHNITNNTSTDGTHFQMTVSDEGVTGAGRSIVNFKIENLMPTGASCITNFYFYDGHLLDSAGTITDESAGVVVDTWHVRPEDLPGFDTKPWTRVFSADSNAPHTASNGVNPGESITFQFVLKAGVTYGTIVDDLQAAPSNPASLVMGLKVQSLPQSDSFINNTTPTFTDRIPPPTPVPLPAPVWGGAALFGMLGCAKLRARRAACHV